MPINTETKRYYFYNFLLSLVETDGGRFTMVYLYLHGFSVFAVLGVVLTYASTCLIILKPIGSLLEKIGPQNTFRLHAISEVLKYAALMSVFIFPVHEIVFFLLWQFFNGFNVMFNRIPLTAYFSVYGDGAKRGQQIGFTKNIQIITGILVPIVFGSLIEETGLFVVATISTIVTVIAIFVLQFDGRCTMKNPVKFKELYQSVPTSFTKSFFFGRLTYPFVHDLLSIYIALSLNSFTLLGIFVGFRAAMSIFVTHYVAKLTDTFNVRPLFISGVFVTVLFWIILPFVHGPVAIVTLQFTLGLAAVIVSIPFESTYHNIAQRSGNALQFAVWREVATQAGLALSCVLVIVILKSDIVPDWQSLMPLGAVHALGMLFILPYLNKNKGSIPIVADPNKLLHEM